VSQAELGLDSRNKKKHVEFIDVDFEDDDNENNAEDDDADDGDYEDYENIDEELEENGIFFQPHNKLSFIVLCF
jgi:hypothetical protein